jgi:hypothetical protein
MHQLNHLNPADIPLKVLICDGDRDAAALLGDALRRAGAILDVAAAASVPDARRLLEGSETNAIFIDPLSLGLAPAADFIFETRKAQRGLVFVLFVNLSAVEAERSVFYRGERRRWAKYYTLDKSTPLAAFAEELRSVLDACRFDLSWRLPEASIAALRAAVRPSDALPERV